MPCNFGNFVSVPVAGVTNGSCGTCTSINKTWVLPWTGSFYQETDAAICSSTVMRLSQSGSTWTLRVGSGADTFAIYTTADDCNAQGQLTLALSSQPSPGICGGWPATITVNGGGGFGVANPSGLWYPCCCFNGYGSLILPPPDRGSGGGGDGYEVCPGTCDDLAAEEFDVDVSGVIDNFACAVCNQLNTTYRVVFNTTGVDSTGWAYNLDFGADAWWVVEFGQVCPDFGFNRGLLQLFCLPGQGANHPDIGWNFMLYHHPWYIEPSPRLRWGINLEVPDGLCFDGDPVATLPRVSNTFMCANPAPSTAILRPA